MDAMGGVVEKRAEQGYLGSRVPWTVAQAGGQAYSRQSAHLTVDRVLSQSQQQLVTRLKQALGRGCTVKLFTYTPQARRNAQKHRG